MNIYIRPSGATQCLYDEKVDLTSLGAVDIKRASHVEPDPRSPGMWFVDLAPVGGPTVRGFVSRAAALEYEASWIESRLQTDSLQSP